MRPSPSVLHVIPDLQTGGAERLVVELAAAVAATGARSIVASEGGAMVAELETRCAIHIPFASRTKNPLAIWSNAHSLKTLVDQHAIDIVHIHSRAPAWSGVLACHNGMRAALITTHHGTYGAKGALKRWYNSGIVRGDAVIAHSKFIADLIAERHPFARRRIVTIPAGIDTNQFSPAQIDQEKVATLRTSWGVADGQRIILSASRLTAWKGQRVLIEAFAQLAYADTTLVLAGDAQGRDDYVADLREIITAFGLKDRVRIVGAVADMPTAYASAAVAAFPSTQAEAFGLAVVEAQAMGVPVVVSNHGAPVETVVDAEAERTGWRVAPGNAAALADGLRAALGLNTVERAALATRARAHIVERYSLAAMTDAHLELYRRFASPR